MKKPSDSRSVCPEERQRPEHGRSPGNVNGKGNMCLEKGVPQDTDRRREVNTDPNFH